MPEQEMPIPALPCPHCKANILADRGFYNYCDETVLVREDNYLGVINGRLYLDHVETDHETDNHECQMDVHCSSCDELLPWQLYEIRELDGSTLAEAEKVIANL